MARGLISFFFQCYYIFKKCPIFVPLVLHLFLIKMPDAFSSQDVKLTASNDDYYFVFEDYLYQVSECMSISVTYLQHNRSVSLLQIKILTES